jgi:DNA-binding NtrC family response regulator
VAKRGTKNRPPSERDALSAETLKAEVLRTIARAFESKAENPTGVLDFDEKRGINFYAEIANFEIEMIRQALVYTKGNQRAAARLLGLKTTTLNSKVKNYKINVTFED